MDEKDLVEGMREYISLLQKEGRYSSPVRGLFVGERLHA